MSDAPLSGRRGLDRHSRLVRGGRSFGSGLRPVPLLSVVLIVLTAGCATKGDVRALRTEVQRVAEQQDRLNRTMEQVRAAALDSLGIQSDVLFSLRGELSRQLLEMQEQLVTIQELTGQSQRAVAGLRDQLEARRSAIDQQIQSPPGTPGADGAPGGAAGGDPQQLYNVALSQFNRGSVTTARTAFQRFITQYPNHRLAAEAHYYLAEIQLQENRPEEALASFLQIPELFPSSERVPNALYRAGQIHDEMGDEDEARELYERVVSSYPDSPVAIFAEERLDDLR